MISLLVTHRTKGKTHKMVAFLAGKKYCVKDHTCIVIYIEPGIIMMWIQKLCLLEKGIHPGKKQMEMRKNIRQLFFFSNKLKVEKSIIS